MFDITCKLLYYEEKKAKGVDQSRVGGKKRRVTRITSPTFLSHLSTMAQLKVFLRSDKATAPTRGSALAAGYDLYSSETATVPARGQALVATDISVMVPENTYGRVAPRLGLAVKHGISTGAKRSHRSCVSCCDFYGKHTHMSCDS